MAAGAIRFHGYISWLPDRDRQRQTETDRDRQTRTELRKQHYRRHKLEARACKEDDST